MQEKDKILINSTEQTPPTEEQEITPIELPLDPETVEILLEDCIATGG